MYPTPVSSASQKLWPSLILSAECRNIFGGSNHHEAGCKAGPRLGHGDFDAQWRLGPIFFPKGKRLVRIELHGAPRARERCRIAVWDIPQCRAGMPRKRGTRDTENPVFRADTACSHMHSEFSTGSLHTS